MEKQSMYYDLFMMQKLRIEMLRDWDLLGSMHPLPRRYHSNWRVLHVDGKTIQFYVPMKYEWAIEAPEAQS